MKNLFYLTIILGLFASCSKFKRVTETKEAPKTEELSELEELGDFDESSSFKEDTPTAQTEEPMQELMEDIPMEKEAPVITKETKAVYEVQREDTLMLISYKLYGHHREWKNIYQINKNILKNPSGLRAGMQLQYYPPQTPPQTPSGNPYLIKSGDSLSLIAGKVYGNIKLWRPIYKNNSQSISDPNLIFAGFTIYYPEKGQVLAFNGEE